MEGGDDRRIDERDLGQVEDQRVTLTGAGERLRDRLAELGSAREIPLAVQGDHHMSILVHAFLSRCTTHAAGSRPRSGER